MPWAPRQRCTFPGCQERQSGPRCARHRYGAGSTSSRNHYGIPRKDRGHGADYDRRRAGLIGQPCFWCGRPATTADYSIPYSKGGTLDDLVPACGRCNFGRRARYA